MACSESGNGMEKPWFKKSENAMWSDGSQHVTVWYAGEPTRNDPYTTNMMKQCAESAIDVYNKTHVNKYSFVELVRGAARKMVHLSIDVIFTAKPDADADADDKTFRARVSIPPHRVESVGFLEGNQENLETVRNSPEEEKKLNGIAISGCSSVWYNGDPTRCDPKTMNILKECADLALEVYMKTRSGSFSLVELVHATGQLDIYQYPQALWWI